MAFNPAPSVWLGAGYDNDAGAHTISFNTFNAASNKLLAQLTDALADPTTGDIRDIMMAVSEAFFQAWEAVADADHPVRMTVTRQCTSGAATSQQLTYRFVFQVDPVSFTMTDE